MAVVVALTMGAWTVSAGETAAPPPTAVNLVVNGDFETDSPASPPPGWCMWGAEVYKVAANYTRDTTAPHGGKACFRIHHPAKTAGYIVTHPQQAIRPRPGHLYTATFWARAATGGTAQFGFSAYETIQPFVDAPSPGWYSIEVEPEWKRFSFQVRESFDFFARRSAFLLLTFKATLDQAQEQTLWLDDVEVTETADASPPGLIDPDTLVYPPLAHRLKPGSELAFTVDVGQHLRPTPRGVGGISFHRVAGWTGQPYSRDGTWTLPATLEAAIRDLRLPMTRFYAVGDEPFGVEPALDRAAEVCGRVNVTAAAVVLELETQSAKTRIAPEVWARAARYAQDKGLGFRCWEVANEPYSSQWGRDMGNAFPTAEAYASHVRAVSAAVRAVQPEAQIGVAIDSQSMRWGNWVLKQTAGAYDFVVGHYYTGFNAQRASFEEIALRENYRTLDHILRTNALIQAYNPDRPLCQLDTEWGVHSSGPNGERADYVNRNANLMGTLHRAVRLIYYAREGMLEGASSWQMLSRRGGQGFGVLFSDAPEARSLLYWLYWQFNRHLGETVVAINGTAPWYAPAGTTPALTGPLTPLLATVSADGKTLYLVLANGSWEEAWPWRAELRGFTADGATGVLLSDFRPGDARDLEPLVERQEELLRPAPVTVTGAALAGELPAHAVLFVTATGK